MSAGPFGQGLECVPPKLNMEEWGIMASTQMTLRTAGQVPFLVPLHSVVAVSQTLIQRDCMNIFPSLSLYLLNITEINSQLNQQKIFSLCTDTITPFPSSSLDELRSELFLNKISIGLPLQ